MSADETSTTTPIVAVGEPPIPQQVSPLPVAGSGVVVVVLAAGCLSAVGSVLVAGSRRRVARARMLWRIRQ